MKTEDYRDVLALEQLYDYLVLQYAKEFPEFKNLIGIRTKEEYNMIYRKTGFFEEGQFLDIKFRILSMKETPLGDKRDSINYPLNVLTELEWRLTQNSKTSALLASLLG